MINKSKHKIRIYRSDTQTELALPFANEGIKAGFPSPAQDFLDQSIDLNKELIKNKEATFYGVVNGDSLKKIGLMHGDILVIDRSMEFCDNYLAVCFIDGEFTTKFIKRDNDIIWLMPENDDYQPIKVTEENQFMVWGVVTYSIKNCLHIKR
ncbi:LexA family protein [Macellibacteroides fermentans]|jgi:DNA polymerase V|uniref:DNA polymerase V n=1 Tax=Macellibacteroides fermentans TaxID=879969 RepID=A0A8E2A439_9PORP|nr:translesion error-prone DNA polymerase V autoproteolytic subunit [Macellibacteroides fermentans]NYI50954.1 DNA polymerase V [Macellibacteroides fermentans]NYI51205.1 DNA polymerase V [Macellibacteroides fermentans]NYI51254.1 DNA polymerase V [Macellibacteroides fermentans]